MEEREYGELKLKYKYIDEFGNVTKSSWEKRSDDESLVHDLVQSACAFLISAGYNPNLRDQPTVIEWTDTKYGKTPTEYEIGHEMLITLKDPEASVTAAIWDGENFTDIKYKDVLAWAYMIPRYDDMNLWY